MSTIPTTFELVHGYRGQVIDLDEQCVVKNFLGKTADEAYEMYCSYYNHVYTEDLMWMNVGGLEYYLPPAFRYVQDDRSKCHCVFTSGLLLALSCQIRRELPLHLKLIIRSAVEYVRSNLSKFVDGHSDEIYLPHMQQQISEIETNLQQDICWRRLPI